MAHHRIAVIPGDGIGKEVIAEGVRLLSGPAQLELATSLAMLLWRRLADCAAAP